METWIIEASSNMTNGAYYVDTIDGRKLYSLYVNDAMEFDVKLDAMIKAGCLDSGSVIHHVKQIH